MSEIREFKTESKRLLELMINSIYTNKEIFLRELISNASDAIDKYHYLSLTDDKLDRSREYEINISIDKDSRTLSIKDNGIGMTKEELIRELLKARIAEARLKKGYAVKGDGTVILYGKKNTK